MQIRVYSIDLRQYPAISPLLIHGSLLCTRVPPKKYTYRQAFKSRHTHTHIKRALVWYCYRQDTKEQQLGRCVDFSAHQKLPLLPHQTYLFRIYIPALLY